jgi:hypothetical protein
MNKEPMKTNKEPMKIDEKAARRASKKEIAMESCIVSALIEFSRRPEGRACQGERGGS